MVGNFFRGFYQLFFTTSFALQARQNANYHIRHMKKTITLFLLIVSFYSNSQVLCGTANENGNITLTAPSGFVFTSIEFASYGTPNGSCESFTVGACHASNSASICSAVFLGNNSASINASNGVFGDPCGGTPKRLYIQARYSTALPLKLVGFTAQKFEQDKIKLEWKSEHEVNTSHFDIERSLDGASFESVGIVAASGNGQADYTFTNTISTMVPVYFYRLKMTDLDGKYQYSNIVRISNDPGTVKLSIFPNPSNKLITINSNTRQEALITSSNGQIITRLILTKGSQSLNISTLNTGIYFIQTQNEVSRFIKY